MDLHSVLRRITGGVGGAAPDPCIHAKDRRRWESHLWALADAEPDNLEGMPLARDVEECPYCAAALSAILEACRRAEEEPGWGVAQIRTRLTALERAKKRKVHPILETAVVILSSGLERLVPDAGSAPAPVEILRRRSALPSDPDVTYQEKVSGDLLFWLEVERTASNICRLSVGVEPVESNGSRISGRAFLEDTSGNLLETFSFANGEIVFDEVPPGEYLIRVEPQGREERIIAITVTRPKKGRDNH
jgi:hypothetical protein